MALREPMPLSRELALVVASGLLLVLAFPPIDLMPAAFVALVPLFFVLTRPRSGRFWSAFRPGFVSGLAFFIPLLYWLALLSSDQMDNPVVMSGPLLLLVLLQSTFWGLFSASSTLVRARTNVPAYVFLPLMWVAFEQLRSLGVIGFTWGALGYAAVPSPPAIQFASATGVFGVSLWIALVNALVLGALTVRGRGRLGHVVAAAVVLAAPFVHGSGVIGRNGTTRSMRVAVIQPNIPAETKWDARYKSLSFDALGSLSREASAHSPDLIVWPETAAPSYLLLEEDDLATVRAIASECGAPILTGCPNLAGEEAGEGSGRPLNSAVLMDTDGAILAVYSKMKLVPFGEVIPFETVIPALEDVNFGEADFWPGWEHVVCDVPEGRFATLICYESTFPRLARQFAAGGAEVLVNITNDVWYGRSPMPFQHASMAVMRAVENRRSIARSANSGVSMLVDPWGRVLSRTAIFEPGFLVADLPIVQERTFYTERGDVFPWAATVLAFGLLALATAKRGSDSA